MFQIMEHKGFPPRWFDWMKYIFTSRTFVIILNGVHGKSFHCKRGVKQGDPLPLLFILEADFLQTLLNQAISSSHLSLPLPLLSDSDFLVLQYVDDTLIFMKWDVTELLHLKSILDFFFCKGLWFEG
jgi:hypothetical protein